MEEQKKGFIQWVKAHKKELIIAGISITAVIAAILGYRNRESIIAMWDTLKKTISKAPVNKLPAVNVAPKVETITPAVANTAEAIAEPSIRIVRMMPQYPFEVTDHIRNLPDGWHASAEKIASAAEHGYELLPGQTWVEKHTKSGLVA